jgi:hypothetical protein
MNRLQKLVERRADGKRSGRVRQIFPRLASRSIGALTMILTPLRKC